MKILTVYAHPADTITNCGGTLALHADAGDDITALIVTHGGRIHPNKYAEEWRKSDPDRRIVDSELTDIVENKKAELRRAADIIGIGRLITMDLDDRMSTVQEDVVDAVAEHIAEVCPDVILCHYPANAAVVDSSHNIVSMVALAAVDRASAFLRNLDGKSELHVKQVFLGGAPSTAANALSGFGVRNDCHVDITPVIGRKIEAMDCFASQGYSGKFARKLVESHNGEYGRLAGVAFAEPWCRYRNETHRLLPLTDAARRVDIMTRHVAYSEIDVRRRYPVGAEAAG